MLCELWTEAKMSLSMFVFCLADKDRVKAKERYIKATLKLHEHHNEYVLAVKAAQVHHQQHFGRSQPALLKALQTLHEEMVLILWVETQWLHLQPTAMLAHQRYA